MKKHQVEFESEVGCSIEDIGKHWAHRNSRSFMNNNLGADQETFQRNNLKNLEEIVASKFMNISILNTFNQVNYTSLK